MPKWHCSLEKDQKDKGKAIFWALSTGSPEQELFFFAEFSNTHPAFYRSIIHIKISEPPACQYSPKLYISDILHIVHKNTEFIAQHEANAGLEYWRGYEEAGRKINLQEWTTQFFQAELYHSCLVLEHKAFIL